MALEGRRKSSSHKTFFALVLTFLTFLIVTAMYSTQVFADTTLSWGEIEKRCNRNKPSSDPDVNYVCDNLFDRDKDKNFCKNKAVRFGAIVSTDSTISIDKTSGTKKLSLTGYHFSCEADNTWYANNMRLSQNACGNAFSLDTSKILYEGDPPSKYSWGIGETRSDILSVDLAALNTYRKNEKNNAASISCTIKINATGSVKGNTTSSYRNHTVVFNFTFPSVETATFASNGISASSTQMSKSGDTFTGDGKSTSYKVTITYNIKRTNGTPASAISGYATSSNQNSVSYASSASAPTNGLTNGQNQAIPVDYTVNVPNGSTVKYCFAIRFDSSVDYDGGTRRSGNFAGTDSACYTITNPHKTYTATFGNATTAGTLDSHDKLIRTDNNTTGTIDHSTRITNRNDYENGRFDDSTYPSSDQYTATFTHVVARTDTKPSDTINNAYATSAKTSWQVQYSLNDGSWTKYDNGETDLSDGAAKTITTQPKWTMNAANAGKYIYYCQRLAYSASSTYKTKTPASGANTYETVLTDYGTNSYTTPACVTLKNPLWTEYQKGSNLVHDINVSGNTTTVNPTGARLINSTNSTAYETTALISSFAFDHKLTRTDSGFSETQIGRSDFDPNISSAFFHPSIHSNCNYAVTTKMWGSERTKDLTSGAVTGTDLIYAKRSSEGVACNGTTKINTGASGGLVNGYEVQLASPNKTSSTSTWSSSTNNGRTATCFHATTNGYPSSGYSCRSDRSATSSTNWQNYLLLAGQTKEFSQGTYNTRSDWYVRYKNIVRCETYTSGYFIGSYPTKDQAKDCKYDRTEVVDTTPVLTTPVYADSSYTTYTIFRPYNYQITDIRPVASSDLTAYAGQSVESSFTISISRYDTTKSYITDPQSPNVYVIGYRIPASYNAEDPYRSKITSATIGATNVTNSGNPQSDICANFYGAPNRIGFGGDSSRCSILPSQPARPVAYDDKNSNNIQNTTYNHVYQDSSYTLNYKTNDIYVPADLTIGEKYCVAIAIANYSTASNGLANPNYYISKSTCSNIAKLPSVNILSGSIKTNGGIETSTSSVRQNDGTYRVYGSWADFAVIADKNIAKMASAASIAQGVSDTGNLPCRTSHLTIANSQCNGTTNIAALGDSKIVSNSTTLDKLRARYIEGNAKATVIRKDTLNASDITASGLNPTKFFSLQPLVVYSSGDLVINTDIILEPNRAFSENLAPQVILIAERDVRIDQSVSHLDAWIVSGGTIDTCTSGNDVINLSANVCNRQLTIRGAILGNKISFKRTYAGDANQNTANTPAEIIQYNAGTLLFSAHESQRLWPETTYLHKLPVRF